MEIFDLPNSHRNNPNIDDDLRVLINKQQGWQDTQVGISKGSLGVIGKSSEPKNAGMMANIKQTVGEIGEKLEESEIPIVATVVNNVKSEIVQPLKSLGRKYKIAPSDQAYLTNATCSPKRSRASTKGKALSYSQDVTLAGSQPALRRQLFIAAAEDDIATVRAIWQRYQSTDFVQEKWRDPKTDATVLHIALEKYSETVATYLLDYGTKELATAVCKISIGARVGKQSTLHSLVQAADLTDPDRLKLLDKILRHCSTGGFLRRRKDSEMLDNFTIRVDPDFDGRARHFTALHIAAYKGDIDMIEALINGGAMVDASHNVGPTPLFYAIRYGHYKTVEKLLKLGANINFETNNRSSPLYWAVRYEQTKIVSLLIDKGANICQDRPQGFGLPLTLAAALGNSDIVDVFLNKGADRNAVNGSLRAPLHFVAAFGHTVLINRLAGPFSLLNPFGEKNSYTLNYNCADKLGSTPLMFAVRGGHTGTVETLLGLGANLSAVNILKQSVWQFALLHKNKQLKLEMVTLLAGYHTGNYPAENYQEPAEDICTDDCHDGTPVSISPLNEVAATNDTEILQVLLGLGVRQDEYGPDGENFLHVAARENCTAVLKEMLPECTSSVVCRQNDEGDTPLMVAARNDKVEAVKAFVEAGDHHQLEVESSTIGITALHIAMRNSDEEITSIILKKACEVKILPHLAEIADDTGNTFLHLAAMTGNTEVLQALHGVLELDTPNDQGDSPLHLAMWYTKIPAIDFLLKHANLGARDHYGRTPLHVAASVPNTPANVIDRIVEAIRTSGNMSMLDIQDDMGCTPLHLAARKGNPETVNALSEVDPGVVNTAGNTALHVAAIRNRPTYLQELLRVFCNHGNMRINQKNQDEATVLHICAKHGDCDSIRMLLRYGADLAKANRVGDTVLHAVVAETAGDPANTGLMMAVYETIVSEVVLWWCRRRKVEIPDESSTTHRNIKRYAILELTTQTPNREGMNVISMATALGASRVLGLILNTDYVFRFPITKAEYGEPLWEYDVTMLTPGADPHVLVAKGQPGDSYQSASRGVGSCLDILATMGVNLTAAQVLELTPLRQLVQNYWGAYQWIYGVLMTVHIVYMGLYTGYAFTLLNPGSADTSSRGQKAAYGMFLMWPCMLFAFELYYLIANIRSWCTGRKQVKVIRRSQEAVGGPVGKVARATRKGVAMAAMVFDNLPHLGATIFAVFVVVWYMLYLVDNPNQVYIIGVVIIIGWLYATSFTKGFKTVHAFNTMIKYIVIRDIARFMFIYLFVLLAFGFALHALFVVAPFMRSTYSSSLDTIFMTFNMMLGMGELFLTEEFDTNYKDAGFEPAVPKVVYFIYIVLSTVIFLNLLIAMMTDTYSSVKRNEGRTWQISTVTLAVRIERKMGFLRRFLSYVKALDISYKLVKLQSPQTLHGEVPQFMYRVMTEISLEQINQDQPNQEELGMQRLENKIDALFRSHSQLNAKVDELSRTVKTKHHRRHSSRKT